MKHYPLLETNLVHLAEFRARRERASADDDLNPRFPMKPRRLSVRSIEHQARMLAHLTEQGRLFGGQK